MSSEQDARLIREILNRLDQLEATAHIIYDKGSYIPTYTGRTTAGVTTYNTQLGGYVRLGSGVFFWGSVIWTAATGTGDALISIPFTSAANTAFSPAVRAVNVTFANGSIECQLDGNTAFFYMRSPATNAAPTNVAVEAAGALVFNGFFFV